jgi:hypothetical protein
VIDGIENFAKNQYEPNHIQAALGKHSLFIWDFNFVPLNRKGRTSARQKRIRNLLDRTHGRFPPNAIRRSSAELIERICHRRKNPNNPLILCTDKHFQYKRALDKDLKNLSITHVTVSSKNPRNFHNILFAANHADLLLRQHIAAFKRETIAFSKTHERMIQRFAIFMVWKNFMRPQYVKPHKRNEKANTHSPAMALGIAHKLYAFHEFFDLKRTLSQVHLNREWQCFYREIPTYYRSLKKQA